MPDITLSSDMDAFLITANDAAARVELGALGGTTGATDRAIIIANGTGGGTAQSSLASVTTEGVLVGTASASGNAIFVRDSLGNNGLGTNGGGTVMVFMASGGPASGFAGFCSSFHGLCAENSTKLGFTAGATSAPDVFFKRAGANSIQLGEDGASPAVQEFGVNAATGANVAGSDFKIKSGKSTGTGIGGSLLFQTSSVGGSGSTANAPSTRLTIDGAGKVAVASGGTFQLGNSASTGLVAGALAALTNSSIVLYDSTGQAYRIPCVI